MLLLINTSYDELVLKKYFQNGYRILMTEHSDNVPMLEQLIAFNKGVSYWRKNKAKHTALLALFSTRDKMASQAIIEVLKSQNMATAVVNIRDADFERIK